MAVVSTSEVKVGILVILSVTLLVALTISVGKFKDLFSNSFTVHIKISSVIGLEPFAQVTYAGVRIGAVSAIRYDETLNMAVVDAAIDRNSPVALDSEARFTSASLLAPLFLEIFGGSPEKRIKTLVAKREIDPSAIYLKATPFVSIGDFFSLAGNVKELLVKMDALLDNLNTPLGQAGGLIANVSREIEVILNEVEQLVVEGRPRILRVLDQTHGLIVDASAHIIPILDHVKTGVAEVPKMATQTAAKMNRVLDQANDLIVAASPATLQTVDDLRKTILDLRERVGRVETHLTKVLSDTDGLITENRKDLDEIILHLKRASANLDDLSAQLAKNPWRAVWKTDERKSPTRVSPEWNPFEK